MKRPLRWVAETLGGAIEGVVDASAAGDLEIGGWSIDSRTVAAGELFIALRGPSFDGNQYAAMALGKGVIAVLVDGEVEQGIGPRIQVPDSLVALQQLAVQAREEWVGNVVAVTGSAGKTTTKDVIAKMLGTAHKTAKTEGNLNNHIGLPLSLLRLDEEARYAVLELGMNHAGEIRELAKMARPDVGVVTNVGWAHIAEFESIAGIAAAKRELVEELGPDGVAVLNADDERVRAMAKHHLGTTLLYGESAAAKVRAVNVNYGSQTTRFTVEGVDFETALQGRHSVSNLLAGIAVAGLYGIRPDQLTDVVRQMEPGKMRGQRLAHNGITIFDDCYNSNPEAVKAMLDVLKDTPARRRIAVLGEMRELGHWAERLHGDVGNYAARCQVDVLVGIRGAAGYMLDAAKRAGLRADAAFFFEDPVEAGDLIRQIAQSGDAILFKGSRGVHVERALQRLVATEDLLAMEEGQA